MSIIAILIAAAVSAGISYGLHIIGKSDNSMDKVRRYADKRMAEFEEFFKRRVEQLRDAKTEFDTMQDRAAATVKRLDSQLTEFDTKSANLENDSTAVKNIEDKINSYGKILNELIDMTASVEENLDLLKKESVIIDKISECLNAQKSNMDGLEKRIPQISQEFSQKNGEQLKAIGTRLLSEYDGRGDKLRQEISTMEENAKNSLEAFKREIAGVYSSAAEKAEKLEDEAFKHLSEQAQNRTDSYIKEISDGINGLEKHLEIKIEETTKLIEERVSNVLSDAENRTSEFDKKYGKVYAELDTKFKQRAAGIDAEIAAKSSELANNYNKSASSIIANIKQNLSELDAKCKNHVDDFAAKYDAKIAALQDKYNKALEAAGNKSDSRVVELQNKIADAEKKSAREFEAVSLKHSQQTALLKQK